MIRNFFLLICLFTVAAPATRQVTLQNCKGNVMPSVLKSFVNGKKTQAIPVFPENMSALQSSNWFTGALRHIAESEYEIKYDTARRYYASSNRSQQLRSFFSPEIFSLQSRSNSTDQWKLELRTLGVFADNRKIYEPGTAVKTCVSKKNLQFHHGDQFTTEFINTPEGVRQNFIIHQAPEGNHNSISVKLKAAGGWRINQLNTTELQFTKSNKGVLEKKLVYNKLKVWDARQQELPAGFMVKGNEISIQVNTAGAVYPVTIDPLSTGIGSTPDSTPDDADQSSALFGSSVSGAGDVNGDGYSDIIIGAFQYNDGANTEEGTAFIYYGSATGLPTIPSQVLDDADQPGAHFGKSVAGAGDVNGDGYSDVMVGAIYYDDGFAEEGAVFIYHGSSSGLAATPSSVLDDADQANPGFGISVSGAGDINGDGYSDVIVGAAYYQDAGVNEGAAFVYYGSGTGLAGSPGAILKDADQSSAFFGGSVAGAGDVNGDGYSDIIIGAKDYDDGVNADEGRAFVYHGSATGISAIPNSIRDDGAQAAAWFGNSVAGAGDVNGDGYSDIIIGAYGFNDGANTDEGRAFVYHGSPAGISALPMSALDDAGQSNAGLGFSVACAGDINGDGYSDVIIGAVAYDDGALINEGAAFIYQGSVAGLSAAPYSTLVNADQSDAGLGCSVAGAGDVNGDGYSDVMAGAYSYDDGVNTNEGRAFVYQGSASGLSLVANWSAESNQVDARLGRWVASAGDVNGDGYGDVIISAPALDNGQADEGRVYVYHGSATGLPASPNWTAESNQASASLGSAAASAGDVNGDGYGDVIVGAPYYSNGQNFEGRAYVYHGSATGLSTTASWTAESNQDMAQLGASVSSAGDVNGDGYGDVIVGVPYYDNTPVDEGVAFIYYGSATGLSTTASWTAESNQTNSSFGAVVAGAGDVNGDGYGDVIISAQRFSNGETNEGKLYVYHGSVTGPGAAANWTYESNTANLYFGFSVAPAGDVNGDGFSDIITGTWNYIGDNGTEGKAYVFHGSPSGLSPILNWSAESNQHSSTFGLAVSGAGDVNGDGYADVVVGSPNYSNGQSSEGRTFVYPGSATGLSTSASWTAESNQANSNYGYSTGAAGDVNGDGFSDLLTGALWFDNGQLDEGMAFVYYGNSSSGLQNNLRLYNSDLITPIQQSNMSDPNLFGAGLFSKSFQGQQKGKLVWETVRNGTPFSGIPLKISVSYTAQQASFTNLGLTGVELKSQVAKRVPTKATYIRARVRYDLVTSITGQVFGPWRYPDGWLRGRRDIGAVILPLEFISFTVQKQQSSSQLQWTTAHESPGVRFEIMHSTDGLRFTDLSVVSGQNDLRNTYQWTHSSPVRGINYYRIKAVENGAERYSVTRSVFFDNIRSVQLFPNPVKAGMTMQLQLSGNFSPAIQLHWLNASGQKIKTEQYRTGNSLFTVSTSGIKAGQYHIELIDETGKQIALLPVMVN